MEPPVRVLFLCTGNSARSVIAEALLRELGGARFEAHSAGTAPKGVNPHTVRVLAEQGMDASGARSKHVDRYRGERFDCVVTVCDDAAERCPVFPGPARRMHWSIPDPAVASGSEADMLDAFRDTVRRLRERIVELVNMTTPPG